MATTARPDTAPAPPRRRRQPVTRIAAAALAVTAVAAAGVAGRTEVAASFAVLGHLHWLWIPAAVLLEAASMAAFAIMLRRLLAVGAIRRLDAEHAELKSMHTAEKARGELRSLLMTHLALLDRTPAPPASAPRTR